MNLQKRQLRHRLYLQMLLESIRDFMLVNIAGVLDNLAAFRKTEILTGAAATIVG
jgi:hypothetical protein